jgi:hypothetical protein
MADSIPYFFPTKFLEISPKTPSKHSGSATQGEERARETCKVGGHSFFTTGEKVLFRVHEETF